MRSSSPDFRTLPSSTALTFSCWPICRMSVAFPLNAKADVRATIRRLGTRLSASMISSVKPSLKYSWSFCGLRSRKGSTATDERRFSAGGRLPAGSYRRRIPRTHRDEQHAHSPGRISAPGARCQPRRVTCSARRSGPSGAGLASFSPAIQFRSERVDRALAGVLMSMDWEALAFSQPCTVLTSRPR